LVGEGLQQLDVMRSESAGLRAGGGDEADRNTPAHQGHENQAAKAVKPRDIPEGRVPYFFGVRDREWLSMLRQPKRLEIFDRLRESRPERCVGSWSGWCERGEMDVALDEAPHRA